MGYIFANIGKYPVPECYDKIASAMGTNSAAVEKFVRQLVEATDSKNFDITDKYCVIFPSGLLIKSSQPDLRNFHVAEHIDFLGEFDITRPEIPFNVNLMTTTACTTDCIYCYADRTLTNILTTDEILGILDEMHKEGVVNVTLTGGDLLTRSDWPILMKRMIKYGYNHFLSTKTPLDRKDLEYLADLGFTEFQFSLDTADPEISKKLVNGGEEYLKKIEHMLNLCSEYGINVQIRTVITKLNGSEESIDNLYNFISKYPCIKSWDLTPAFFSAYKKQFYKTIEANNDDLKRINKFIFNGNHKFPISIGRVNEDGYKLKTCTTTADFVCKNQICLATVTGISILANGKCTVCEMTYQNPEYILGDIRKQSLKEIWNSPKTLRFYKPDQSDFPKDTPCSKCKDFSSCRQSYGKRICFSDICKTGFRPVDPDPRCPKSIDLDIII